MKIIKENGKIWGVEKDLCYGVWHYKKVLLGEDNEETKEEVKKKKQKKEVDE